MSSPIVVNRVDRDPCYLIIGNKKTKTPYDTSKQSLTTSCSGYTKPSLIKNPCKI